MKKTALVIALRLASLRYFLAGLCVLSAANAVAQSSVEGFVFEDANRNGRRDRGERGVAQAAVSNGRDVTLTDAAGKYRLPVGNDDIVFVIKPAGYRLPLDEHNIPRAFYIHKPDGSPAMRYEGVKPTGKLPKSVDFAVNRYDEPESFAAFIFGDTQIYNEQELDYMTRRTVAEAKEHSAGVSFGITLGDLVGDSLNLHGPYKEAVGSIGLPWYNVMGNHDMNYDAKSDSLSDENFELHFGSPNYAFNYSGAHFIILDDILYPHPLTGKGYWGGLRDDQLKFVENDLKHVPADRLIVISMHIPLVDAEGFEAFRKSDRERLCELLKPYNNVLVLSAHTHFQLQRFLGKEQGVDRIKPIHEYNVGATCGDWYSGILNADGIPLSTMRDGTPAGFAVLRITGNEYVVDYKAFGHPADYQIAVGNPKVVRSGRSTSAVIHANFFMGCRSSLVEYRVDNRPWAKMRWVNEADLAYLRYMQDWDYADPLPAGRRPSNPVRSDHQWTAPTPTNLPPGEHSIEVRATDIHGRVFTSKSKYRIE
jgi:3',5'-cyclic AMP phosphodiesterase CpdA